MAAEELASRLAMKLRSPAGDRGGADVAALRGYYSQKGL
jgi:hypothetical protein